MKVQRLDEEVRSKEQAIPLDRLRMEHDERKLEKGTHDDVTPLKSDDVGKTLAMHNLDAISISEDSFLLRLIQDYVAKRHEEFM